MRETGRAPSIVPKGDDETVYLVLDNLGRLGRIWPEVDAETTDLETVILDLLEGQYKDPVRVIGFNTAERGWSQDISVDVAHELRHRCDLQQCDVPFFLQSFTDQHLWTKPSLARLSILMSNYVLRNDWLSSLIGALLCRLGCARGTLWDHAPCAP